MKNKLILLALHLALSLQTLHASCVEINLKSPKSSYFVYTTHNGLGITRKETDGTSTYAEVKLSDTTPISINLSHECTCKLIGLQALNNRLAIKVRNAHMRIIEFECNDRQAPHISMDPQSSATITYWDDTEGRFAVSYYGRVKSSEPLSPQERDAHVAAALQQKALENKS